MSPAVIMHGGDAADFGPLCIFFLHGMRATSAEGTGRGGFDGTASKCCYLGRLSSPRGYFSGKIFFFLSVRGC